jgi:dTDP-4-dehydrorhamnose reductase
MRILITGANGQVGWELQRALQVLGEIAALERGTCDLSSAEAIRTRVRELRPQVIVNAAAYTAVDKAESEFEAARAINSIAPGILAEEAQRYGALLVHYSTDYVFDGAKEAAYLETDAPNPLSEYGRSKLAGEQLIQSVDGPHVILRTSWVYGARRSNFLLTMLRLASERDELRVVDDQHGTPTWCRTIAEATGVIVAKLSTGAGIDLDRARSATGVYHLTAAGRVSWYGFARAIIERTQHLRTHAMPTIRPIATSEYASPAARPKNSVLCSDKIEHAFGITCPGWEHALDLCLAELPG